MKKTVIVGLLLINLVSSAVLDFFKEGKKEEKKKPIKVEEEKKEFNDLRRAGILMHITSLPSKYGIGSLGEECYKFIDFLKETKQKCWQMLPINPTGFGDSPYQAVSSFAGNPYLLDLDTLIEEKLLTQDEVDEIDWFIEPERVDFGIMFFRRYPLLKKAFSRFKETEKYKQFVKDNQDWIEDYALFMSLKEHFEYKSWTDWPKDIRNHEKKAIEKYKKELKDLIKFHYFLQFKFEEQFSKVKEYANEVGIKLIGDVPIYVPQDSSDAWANPENFQIDKEGNPEAVAGVPPDAFTADGQLWGNPLYDWKKMEKTGFKWWVKRLQITSRRFDIIRIDHFRGLESYWAVPFGDTTAKNGKWLKGPGHAFIDALHKNLPDIEFIAEDLGYLTPEVKELLEYSKFPGMKVLEFAFDSREPSNYLPHSYTSFSVVYPGTHDNAVLTGWQKEMNVEDKRFAEKYLGLELGTDLRIPVIRAAMSSVSALCVVQLQDYFGLGKESRMNRPGIASSENWTWRLTPEYDYETITKLVKEMTEIYGRA